MRHEAAILVLIASIGFANAINPRDLTREQEDDLILSKARCSTLSCVHSSALILQKVDLDIRPCDDFYRYACGTYLAEQHTPDEKAAVDTLRFMYEQMIEYLLRLFEHPGEIAAPKAVHHYAQNFFDSCMSTLTHNIEGLYKLRTLLQELGGWPLIEAQNWNEKFFDTPQKLILNFRRVVNNATDNIFNTRKDPVDKKEKSQGLSEEEKKEVDPNVLFKQSQKLLGSMVTGMGGVLDDKRVNEIREILEFERAAAEYNLKFLRYQKLYSPKNRTQLSEMKKINKYMLYLNYLSENLFNPVIEFEDEDIPSNFNQLYVDFIKNTPKRQLANFVFWRIAQASLSFMDKDTRNIVLSFRKNTYGSEDVEQRWIYCTELAATVVTVGAGSIYIDGYFPKEDKNAADQLVDYIVRAYNDTIVEADWMDNNTRGAILELTNRIHRFIGYHENMRNDIGYEFYNSLPLYTDHEDFLKTGLTFKIFSTDREYLRAIGTRRQVGSLDEDWTKYAKPATVNAYYSDKDNSIQFPAGILAIPNFDKSRPPFMNFGGIGSIIGHEITHSFDNLARRVDDWDAEAQKKYRERKECIMSQYAGSRIPDVDAYLRFITGNSSAEVRLNATSTINEDIADNGGIKLAYKAWKLYEKEHLEGSIRPIGLDSINNIKMFWLTFAQTYCGIDRAAQKLKKLETDNHSLEQFRVNIPLMNIPEFSEAWSCEPGTPMNPVKKCSLW